MLVICDDIESCMTCCAVWPIQYGQQSLAGCHAERNAGACLPGGPQTAEVRALASDDFPQDHAQAVYVGLLTAFLPHQDLQSTGIRLLIVHMQCGSLCTYVAVSGLSKERCWRISQCNNVVPALSHRRTWHCILVTPYGALLLHVMLHLMLHLMHPYPSS